MTTRRRFIQLSTVAGLVPACRGAFAQGLPADPSTPVAPAPAVPAPAPAPVAPTPVAPAPGVAPAAGPLVSESEPQAVALGYVNDARRADRLRFPKYRPGQHCGNCQNFQGPSNAAKAPCAQFGSREVQGPGWCSSHQLRIG